MRRFCKRRCVPGRQLGGGEPGKGSEGPAASLVSGGTWGSHQDASFRAGRLGVVGPIFGDGLLSPVELRSRTPPRPTRRARWRRLSNLVVQVAVGFRRAPSGTSPVVT
jgi:hypothetical protein